MLWNRRLSLLLLVPSLALLPAASGCVHQPAISIHHVEPGGLSTFGVGVVIVLQVHNENAYDVQIRSVHCNVTFGRGTVLGPIDFAPNQWLPANQTTLVRVPVSLPWTVVPALIAESANGYSIPYHVTGAADVTATSTFGIQRNNYPIEEDGFVPRQMVVDSARSMNPFRF